MRPAIRQFLFIACAVALVVRAHAAPLEAIRTLEVSFPSAEPGVVLTAHWTAPPVTADGAPAIIALHGCDGLPTDRSRVGYPRNRYTKMLRDAGAGVLYVDSFGPRGEVSICAQKVSDRKIFDDNRRMDVAGALQWLAKQPGIDARRLGVLGWSHGGSTVLAVADATNDAVRQAAVKPAALVAFYPGCGAYDLMLRYDVVAPLLVMAGELDNWTPAAPCERLTRRLISRGQPVRYVQYPGSYHAFDGTSPVTERDNAGGTRFGKAMAGGNPEARAASAVEMLRFYEQYLGLHPAAESKLAEVHASAVPAPTQFAALADVDRLPKVSENGKALYREWLTKPFPRAVAVSGQGALARGYGAQAIETAVRNCEKLGDPCRLYAVDDQVVWTSP